ncbi:Histidyl-tRNA synthetase [Hordeum vulgare]|nr:Histidyl-tRNA synthetase [Hordeum vulgare]
MTKQQPLIGTAPARRPAAPPKTRATSTPTRSSARLAAIGSSVPVAQHASLRLVKELGLLGPRDKLTEEVARALGQRFDEPLFDSDISVIARLTRLDNEVLRVMARMNGPDGAVDEATV